MSDPRFERDDLRQITVKSPALGHRADLSVHAPTRARETPNVPLVILLHGVYGSHWAWSQRGGAHRTSVRLQAEGAIGPMVLAMPSDGLWGDGSGYLPHRLQDFERWIAYEVPAAVSLMMPNVTMDSPLFIAGLSMGGFGALRIGAKYPKRFRAISGHSSMTEFSQMPLFVEERLGSFTALAEDHSVLDTMVRQKSQLPEIRFDCGTEDRLLEHNRTLHRHLLAAGIPHVYQEFPGGHEWSYWETHLAETLRFFWKTLESPGISQRGI